MKTIIMTLTIALSSLPILAQPVQSNASSPEPAATTVQNGQVTGAARVPSTVKTPDPGTHMGAGNTAVGLYTNDLTRTGDLTTSRTAANPTGAAVVENPGVRSGTAPLPSTASTVSQTNLGAQNTGTARTDPANGEKRSRAPVTQPGSSSAGSHGATVGGQGSGT
jgi:hypothetical protein